MTSTPARICIGVSVLLSLVAAPASADFINEKNQWVFKGSTFAHENQQDRKDPINIFFGGGGFIDADRVNTHLDDDWDTSAVGGHPWRKNDEIFSVCKDEQWAVWRFHGGDEDRSDQHGTTARKRLLCSNQHHARLWDDFEHDALEPSHSKGDWLIAGFHHDKTVVKTKCYDVRGPVDFCHPVGLGHKPDRDWDDVRVEAIKAMNTHCTRRRWRRHPDARRWYQERWNSGYIGRIAMGHRSNTNCDAV